LGVTSNDRKLEEKVIEFAFTSTEKGHEDYIEAFTFEMNRQCQKLRLKNSNFLNSHGLS
jgi:hypothetical protein